MTNLQICRENFMAVPIVIYTRKNFYLLKAMNRKIETLNAAGLIEYWYSLSFMQDLSSHEVNPPKMLTFDHLSGCFEIWTGGCLVSFLSFIAEWMFIRWKKANEWKKILKKVQKGTRKKSSKINQFIKY
ncbi:hypothetical protein ACKWTF_010216 [Chironomus riparius]